MIKRFHNFLRRFRQHRTALVPIRIHSVLTIGLLGLTVLAVSPRPVAAQRTSTSEGRVERSGKRSAGKTKTTKQRSRDKAATRSSNKRSSTSKAIGRAAKAASKARDSRKNSRASRDAGQRTVERARDRGDNRAGKSGSARGTVQNGAERSGANRGNENQRGVRNGNRSADTRVSSGRVGTRVLDRSDNGRVAAARGATSTRRDNHLVINGNRSRLNLPNVRATWRSSGHQNVRYRTRLNVRPHFVYVRPYKRIHVHIAWPWEIRYTRHWSPRYRYRQVVVVRSDWGRSHRESRIEMETTYRHKVRYANDEYAVLDIDIEQIAIYDNGRFLGMMDRIPNHLSSIEATVFRNGDIAFDRDIFLVGDRRAGFEIISTDFYDGYAGQGYRRGDLIEVGRVDLRKGRVRSVGRSRLFNPDSWRGFAPISLLPEDEGWLWDFGADAISAAYDDYDAYYGHGSGNWGGYRSERAYTSQNQFSYDAQFGAAFTVNRSAEIRRVE